MSPFEVVALRNNIVVPTFLLLLESDLEVIYRKRVEDLQQLAQDLDNGAETVNFEIHFSSW